MKKMMNWMMAAILICGASVFTSCSSNDDNPTISSQQEMEKSLIGLWYEEFDYEDMTGAFALHLCALLCNSLHR